MRLVLAFVKD